MTISKVNTYTYSPLEAQQNSPKAMPFPLNMSQETPAPYAFYRKVFQTTEEIKNNFTDFLQTIFYQLDEKKVFALMEDILKDPTKTDVQIYEELLTRIDGTKKPFSFFSMIKALFVVRSGVALQATRHLEGFEKTSFLNYMEIFNRRYCSSIQKQGGLSFKKTTAVCDRISVTFKDKVEAGAFSYPYQKSLSLNNADCLDPTTEIEKTYKPLGEEIEDMSLDLVACLGGLHHTPQDRLEPFISSIYEKMKTGGVFLVRDHNAFSEEVTAIANVVHSFVNAVDGATPLQEKSEIRNFQSEQYWQQLIEKQGFKRIDRNSLILHKDPTQNGLMAFIKNPIKAVEIEQAAVYQKNYLRSPVGSYSTWLEWGNVRFAKQYAEFIQNKHEYGFDFIGHIYQHWTHFYYAMKKTLESSEVNLQKALFSDNMAMNLFILLGTTTQLGFSALVNLPSSFAAKWIFKETETDVHNLSALEKFMGEFQKDYCEFIDYDPFFKYPYFQTIKTMWQRIIQSEDSFFTKISDIGSAIGCTASIGIQGLFSTFIDKLYYSSESSSDLEIIHVILEDPQDLINSVIEKWENWKDSILDSRGEKPYANSKIEVIHSAEGKKLISVPFYKPFTKFAEIISEQEGIHLCKVGGQEKITLDLFLGPKESSPHLNGADLVYQMNRLQDVQKRRYLTYEVAVTKLQEFCRLPEVEGHIQHIHAHR